MTCNSWINLLFHLWTGYHRIIHLCSSRNEDLTGVSSLPISPSSIFFSQVLLQTTIPWWRQGREIKETSFILYMSCMGAHIVKTLTQPKETSALCYTLMMRTTPKKMDHCDDFQEWNRQLRRILYYIHKALLHHMQEELLLLLPVQLQQVYLWLCAKGWKCKLLLVISLDHQPLIWNSY